MDNKLPDCVSSDEDGDNVDSKIVNKKLRGKNTSQWKKNWQYSSIKNVRDSGDFWIDSEP